MKVNKVNRNLLNVSLTRAFLKGSQFPKKENLKVSLFNAEFGKDQISTSLEHA